MIALRDPDGLFNYGSLVALLSVLGAALTLNPIFAFFAVVGGAMAARGFIHEEGY